MGLFSKRIIDKVQDNDLEGVKKRIAEGYDLHKTDMFGMTPLHEAAMSGYLEIGRVLLDAGARLDLYDSKDTTVLGQAIDENHEDFALMCIEYGAKADASDTMGRTPLQSAIKRDMIRLVVAMLEAGAADPNYTCNNYTPYDYIRKDSPHKADFERLLKEFSSLENAIQASNVKAVNVVVQRTYNRNNTPEGDIANSVEAYFTAVRAGYPLPDIRHQLLRDLLIAGDVRTFVRVLVSTDAAAMEINTPDVDVDQLAAMVDIPSLLTGLRFGEKQGTPLHVAAFHDREAMVRFLLFDGHVNPFDVDADNKRAIDVLNKEETSDLDAGVRLALEYAMSKLVFDEAISRLLKMDSAARVAEAQADIAVHDELVQVTKDLEALAKNMTDIQDLRVLISIAPTVIPRQSDVRALLLQCFQRVMDAKLVLDDNDAIYFQKVLKLCLADKVITDDEHSYWSLQLVKVNMESAKWALQLKQSIQKLAWRMAKVERNVDTLSSHFNKLRTALIQQEQAKAQAEKVEQMVTMVSTALMFVGGPMVRRFFDGVVHLNDPTKLLLAAFDVTEDTVKDFLMDKTKELVVEKSVGKLLGDAGIEPVEFAAVLRDAIVMERGLPSSVSGVTSSTMTSTTMSIAVVASSVDVGVEALRLESGEGTDSPAAAATTGTTNAITASAASVTETSATSTATTTTATTTTSTSARALLPGMVRAASVGGHVLVDIVQELEGFPYHLAVQSSAGNLDEFKTIVEYIEPEDGDINAVAKVHVHDTSDEGKDPTDLEIDAAEFASYLGYVDVVKYLLDRPDRVPKEKKFVTIQRAQAHAKPKVVAAAC